MSKTELNTIKELISDFEKNKEYYLSKDFPENHCKEKFNKTNTQIQKQVQNDAHTDS